MLGRFETFTFAISEISQYWSRIAAEEMKQYDLKGAHAVYLCALYRHPEGITSAKLSEICNKDKADISRAVSTMEKKGLAGRENTSGNLYRAPIKLTKAGLEAAVKVRKRAELAVAEGGKGISDENRIVFYETLKQIAANLKKISKEGLPE